MADPAAPDVSGQVANGVLKAVLVLAFLAFAVGVLVWGWTERERQANAYIQGSVPDRTKEINDFNARRYR